ncbi:MAG: ABC transporter substrate-binding protein [Synergistaceae bacterium]|jgi:iron complex transport system substrate-binding protein|nr:ABC transporter substrate-binding protein [Synergistaceae bacterium]
MACPYKIKKIIALILIVISGYGVAQPVGAQPEPERPAPERIVSLYPGHTDNIVALGAGHRLVAVSRSEDPGLWDSGQSLDLPRLPPKVGAEAVLALEPDAVFLRSLVERMNPHLTDTLRQAGVEVHVIDPPSWEGFEEYLACLAEILGTSSEAARQQLEDTRAAIADAAAKASSHGKKSAPRVFLEATSKELHTCAPGSWAARLIELAGGVNAAANAVPLRKGSALAPWGIERILKAADSGLDVYLVQQGAMNAASLEEVRGRPWFTALALKVQSAPRLAVVPESCLSRPSLLGLAKGGRMLVEIFYGNEDEAAARANPNPDGVLRNSGFTP